MATVSKTAREGLSDANRQEPPLIHAPLQMTASPAALIDSLALLTGEPDLGVVLLDPNLEIVEANAAARRVYLPEPQREELLQGRSLASLFPAPFPDEVDRLVGLQREAQAPLLIRGIWRGHAVLTSVYAQPGGGYLLLGRRGHPPSEQDVPTDHERVDAEVLDLGELSVLTPRELEVLSLLGTGGTLKDAAASLGRSVKTVESHRDNIARKLGLSRRGELVRVVERSGLRPSDIGRSRIVMDEPAARMASLGASPQ